MDDKDQMVDLFDRLVSIGNNVITITPDGHVTADCFDEVAPLEYLQKKVEGYIEIACEGTHNGEKWVAYVNEEGLLNNLPNNPLGDLMCEGLLKRLPHQPFFGNIVFLYGRKLFGET